jgi:hypothetical protein
MKRIIQTVGVVAVASASALTGITSAQAAPACPTARVCFYDDFWFTGTQRTFGWVTYNVGVAANDRASSIVVGPASDRNSPYVYFYQDDNFKGHSIIFKAGNAMNDLRGSYMEPGRNWDDEITSIWG